MPTLWPLSYRGTRSSSLTFNTSYLYRVHSRYNLVPVSFIAQSGTRNNKLVCAYVFCAHKLRFGTKIETYQFEKCSCPLMTEVRYWRTYCNILQRSTTVHFLNSCTMRNQGRRSISNIWGGGQTCGEVWKRYFVRIKYWRRGRGQEDSKFVQ